LDTTCFGSSRGCLRTFSHSPALAKLTAGAHSTAGSTLGACVGLFFLAGFYRFLFALRTAADLKWIAQDTGKFGSSDSVSGKGPEEQRSAPRFSLKTNLQRGLLEGFQSFVGYLLMLVVRFCFFIQV
jgi:hypothetical protein